MTHKIHLRTNVATSSRVMTACSSTTAGTGKVRNNSRASYRNILAAYAVTPDEFRTTPDADRCAHCCDQFLSVMNRRRAASGKPLYKNAWTKETV